jgi:hypothetical protein
MVCDTFRKLKYKLPSSNQSILPYLYSQTYQNRNKSWKHECVLSFNMGWRIFYPSPLGKLLMFMLMFEWCKVHCSLFSWITLWNLCHTLNICKVAYFYGKNHDSYPMQRRNARYLIFMVKLLMLMLMFEWCKVVYFHG